MPEILVVVIQKYLGFPPAPLDVDLWDDWAMLSLLGWNQLSVKLIANAVLRKEQRPAKKHENELIL